MKKIGNIQLTDQEINNLLSGLPQIKKESEPMSATEVFEATTSTFNESFPNYIDEKDNFIFFKNHLDNFKKRFKADIELSNNNYKSAVEILEENGIIAGIQLSRKNDLLSGLTNKNQLLQCIVKLDNYMQNTLNISSWQQIIDSTPKDVTINLDTSNISVNDIIKLIAESNKSNINILDKSGVIFNSIQMFSLVSVTLGFRALFSTYIRYHQPPVFSKDASTEHQNLQINKYNKKLNTVFFIAIPVLLGGLYYLQDKWPSRHIIEITQTQEIGPISVPSDIGLPDNTPSSSNLDKDNNISKSLFLGFITKIFKNNKINWFKWFKYLSLFIWLWTFILKYYFKLDDKDNYVLTIFLYIKNFISQEMYIIKWLILIYAFIITFICFLVYLRYKYFYEVEFKNIPRNLPKFILNWIEKFNKESKLTELKIPLTSLYYRTFIFYCLLTLIYLFIVLYF